ncbi:MAG TPA: phosphoribosylanthranilate isomerase [Thermoanaerobaculia bacterium]|nr:phosphoribosylanthranilate isomerase [Thermoanaerobaculia bacterium]
MTDVKICGLTRQEDVTAACALGASFVGFNFSSRSRRRVDLETASRLAGATTPGVRRVGVFVDESYREIECAIEAASLDLVQLHRTLRKEDLDQIRCRILAVAHAGRDEEIPPGALLERCAGILFDTSAEGRAGGTGAHFDWFLLEGKSWPVPLFVAGGLAPENVGESIRKTRPSAVDVASGVESSPGVKDRDRMRRFFEAVREADEAR